MLCVFFCFFFVKVDRFKIYGDTLGNLRGNLRGKLRGRKRPEGLFVGQFVVRSVMPFVQLLEDVDSVNHK
jgi:hypothetical protein